MNEAEQTSVLREGLRASSRQPLLIHVIACTLAPVQVAHRREICPCDEGLENVTSHTVGIVEDDAAIRDSLRLLLDLHGISACCFESAADFLDSADIDQFGSLLVDQHMPKMTGIELIELLRSRSVTTPAIMITGGGNDRTLADRAKKAGVIAILQKPFAGAELEGWIRLALITGKNSKPSVQ